MVTPRAVAVDAGRRASELRSLGDEMVGSFARFPEAVTLDKGFALVDRPGMAVQRAGQGSPGGERTSDPRDARSVADLLRIRELRPILPDDDTLGALRLQVGRRREPIRDLAADALQARAKIGQIDRDLEALLADCPEGARIPSLPGTVLAAAVIACAGDIRRFGPADAPASTAGLAPGRRQPAKRGGWRRAHGSDKVLKRVFCQSALCAIATADPLSRAFRDRKPQDGKHHTQACFALARRRVTAIRTMLRRREAFDPCPKAARHAHHAAASCPICGQGVTRVPFSATMAPPFQTVSRCTCPSTAISASGSPSTRTRSASRPGAIRPASIPRISALTEVAAAIASA